MTQSRDQLRSQRLRLINHQGDALRLGMNWTEEDLGKPQVLVDSAYGQGHPGTFHFRELIEEVSNGIFEAGGKPGVFAVSDICDGVVQATSGMSYLLISGNDKSVPAHLLAIARCDIPAIHLPGGTQLNAPDYVASNKLWSMGAEVERGDVPKQDLEIAQRGVCPTCGACQFMGSASTGDGDLISIDVPRRRLDIVGVAGETRDPEEIDEVLAERRRIWQPPRPRHETGILSLYSRVARAAAEGASIT